MLGHGVLTCARVRQHVLMAIRRTFAGMLFADSFQNWRSGWIL